MKVSVGFPATKSSKFCLYSDPSVRMGHWIIPIHLLATVHFFLLHKIFFPIRCWVRVPNLIIPIRSPSASSSRLNWPYSLLRSEQMCWHNFIWFINHKKYEIKHHNTRFTWFLCHLWEYRIHCKSDFVITFSYISRLSIHLIMVVPRRRLVIVAGKSSWPGLWVVKPTWDTRLTFYPTCFIPQWWYRRGKVK